MDSLRAWESIPGSIAEALRALGQSDLDRRAAKDGMSIREQVHHIVEANVVAASIVIAALGSPGCTYDWSWMMPFGAWLDRLAYREKPIGPALRVLDALSVYVVAQLEPLADGLEREVHLRDAPGADLRRVTVAEVLQAEVDHAAEHIGEIAKIGGRG
jgi:hypothetical protein